MLRFSHVGALFPAHSRKMWPAATHAEFNLRRRMFANYWAVLFREQNCLKLFIAFTLNDM